MEGKKATGSVEMLHLIMDKGRGITYEKLGGKAQRIEKLCNLERALIAE